MKVQVSYCNNYFIVEQLTSDDQTKICSKTFLDVEPMILKSNEDFKRINDKHISQDLLYMVDKKWTLDEAREYLNTLLKSSIENLKHTSMYKRFNERRMEADENFRTTFSCEGLRNTNFVSISNDNSCSHCGEIELPTKCSFCPISVGCPICGCVDKQNICYMHQAECIAMLILSQKEAPNPRWVFRTLIPDSWVKQFGKEIYDQVNDIRDQNIINILFYSDLLFVYKVTIKRESFDSFDDIAQFLRETQLRHTIHSNCIIFYADSSTLDMMQQIFDYDDQSLKIDYIEPERYQNDSNMNIRGITFGKDKYADIPIHIGKELGNPHNPFTYSILYTMKDYINSNTKTVLDIGCGNGITSIYAKKCGANHVTAMDIDDGCIRKSIELANDSIPDEMSSLEFVEENIFHYISYTEKKYDVIVGNLYYSIQKDLLPIISNILTDNGIYILGGCPILMEKDLLKVDHNNLEIIDTNYFYNSMIIIFRKKD